MLVGDIVEYGARKHPDRIALRFEDRRIGYRELRDRSRRLANALLGVAAPGDRVADLAIADPFTTDAVPDLAVADSTFCGSSDNNRLRRPEAPPARGRHLGPLRQRGGCVTGPGGRSQQAFTGAPSKMVAL